MQLFNSFLGPLIQNIKTNLQGTLLGQGHYIRTSSEFTIFNWLSIPEVSPDHYQALTSGSFLVDSEQPEDLTGSLRDQLSLGDVMLDYTSWARGLNTIPVCHFTRIYFYLSVLQKLLSIEELKCDFLSYTWSSFLRTSELYSLYIIKYFSSALKNHNQFFIFGVELKSERRISFCHLFEIPT